MGITSKYLRNVSKNTRQQHQNIKYIKQVMQQLKN